MTENINFLKKLLNLIKKFSLDPETITQLFKLSTLDRILFFLDHVKRQKAKKFSTESFKEMNLLELKGKIDNFEEIITGNVVKFINGI